jgi:hypothetical protein
MKKLAWVLTITVLVVFYVGGYYWITNGILQVRSGDIFLSNYDDLDKVKTWDQLRSEHLSLDPSKASWSQMPETSKPVTLTIEAVNKWEEFEYPKTIVAIHLNITIQSSTAHGYLRVPTLLILVLDEKDDIRGKLYTSVPSLEPSNSQQSYGMRLWFRLPQDMTERRYGIVALLFGEMDWSPTIATIQGVRMSTINGQYFDVDQVYGVLPAWDYSASYSPTSSYYALLDYAKDYNRVAPPSTFSFGNMISTVSIASALIPSLLGAVVVFRNRLRDLKKSNPDLTSGIVYILLCLALFSAMIVALVLLR